MTKHELDQNEYQIVFNSTRTYDGLAKMLEAGTPVVFAWTDQQVTRHDLLMVYRPVQFGNLQRGMSARTDLFVAVASCGMFGFELNGIERYSDYIGKKLGLGGENTTTIKLAELINEVSSRLENAEKLRRANKPEDELTQKPVGSVTEIGYVLPTGEEVLSIIYKKDGSTWYTTGVKEVGDFLEYITRVCLRREQKQS